MEFTVGTLLTKWSVYTPDKTAVIFDDKEISYRELNENVNRTANYLLAKGIKKGDRVSEILQNCPELLYLYFAAAKIGAVFCPINIRLTAEEIQYQLNDSGSRFLLFDDSLAEKVEAVRLNASIEKEGYCCADGNVPEWATDYKRELMNCSTDEPHLSEPVDWEDIQIIMYTSGTTGNPKGAMLSHRKTFFNTLNAFFYHELRVEDIVLSPYPLFHSAGLLIYGTPALSRGATILLRKTYTPEQMLKDIETYKVTTFGAVTTVLKRIMDSGLIDDYDLSSVRIFGGGGEKTPIDLIERLASKGLNLQQRMGQTETSTICSLPRRDTLRKKGSIGLPVIYADVKIVDESGKEMPPGEKGEIVVKGPTVMSGYWNKPEETAKTIRDGILHTGDLAYRDEEGYFYIVDRIKDMYRSGGENVYPAEVEKLLLANPKISQVAIIGVPDPKWTEVGKAFIVTKEGESITKAEVLEFLEGKVAKFKMPVYVQFMDSLPATAAGKVRKIELKSQFGNASD